MVTINKTVKCRYCKKEIIKNDCYKVEYLTKALNVRYRYYCNEECEKKETEEKENEIRLKEIERSARETTREILEIYSDKNIYFSKMYKDLRDTFGDEAIYHYINDNRHEIEHVLATKNFMTTNSKLKYFFAMAQDCIEKHNFTNIKYKNIESTNTIFDDFEIIETNNNKKRSIDDILGKL